MNISDCERVVNFILYLSLFVIAFSLCVFVHNNVVQTRISLPSLATFLSIASYRQKQLIVYGFSNYTPQYSFSLTIISEYNMTQTLRYTCTVLVEHAE